MGFFDFLGGGGKAKVPTEQNLKKVVLPDFKEDPFVKKTQDPLFGFGEGIVSRGEVPKFLSPILDEGGSIFENFLQRNIADITRSITESGARTSSRSPVIASQVGKATADITSRLRFGERDRVLGARERIFSSGVGALEGVRGAGINLTNLANVFALGKSGQEITKATELDRQEAAKIAAENAAAKEKNARIGSLIKTGIGIAATIATGGAAAPLLALGSATGGQ